VDGDRPSAWTAAPSSGAGLSVMFSTGHLRFTGLPLLRPRGVEEGEQKHAKHYGIWERVKFILRHGYPRCRCACDPPAIQTQPFIPLRQRRALFLRSCEHRICSPHWGKDTLKWVAPPCCYRPRRIAYCSESVAELGMRSTHSTCQDGNMEGVFGLITLERRSAVLTWLFPDILRRDAT
jgi:hypothetical protein